MQNNPSQNVHTDYVRNDVFIPGAANRLAESIQYDFVVTQAQWDNYLGKHGGITEADLGDVIASNADGTDSASFSTVAAPVSIYIAADTSDLPLVLDGRLISLTSASDGPIVDISAYTSSGTAQLPQTDGAINIYSARPYTVKNVVGGINHWSTPQSRVQFNGIHSVNGMARVGAYATPVGVSLDYEGLTNCRIVCMQLVSGPGFIVSPSAAQAESGYYPTVVHADWMVGAAPGCIYYKIFPDTVSMPGLFQQIASSCSEGTEPLLYEMRGYSAYTYRMTKNTSTTITYSNVELGLLLHIRENGDIYRESIGVVDGVVLTDYDISDVPLLLAGTPDNNYNYAVSMKSESYDWTKVSVFRNGHFMSILEDCPDFSGSSLSWYAESPSTLFKFKGSRVLDFYRWHAIFSTEAWPRPDAHMTDSNSDWYFHNGVLPIDKDDLSEGVIYTIRIHTVLLPFNVVTTPGITQYIDTETPLFKQATDDSLYRYVIKFYDSEGTAVMPAYWGSSTANTRIGSSFNVYVLQTPLEVREGAPVLPGGGEVYNQVLVPVMYGEVLFVKLGGTVYIMRY